MYCCQGGGPPRSCSMSNASITTVSLAKLASRRCRIPSSWTLGAPADPRVQALLHVLLLFLLVQGTFRHRDLREHLASLLGQQPSHFSPGRITYDLRRLRFHGIIERIPQTHRCRITAKGLRSALFFTRLYDRSLRTGLAIISPAASNPKRSMAKSIRAAEAAINNWYEHETLAA
jgi:hypothetical protein